MKDSGVPWLGEVPEHWEMKRGKNLFRCVDVRSETGEEELLTVSSDRGVVLRRTASVTMFKAESYAGHKLCWPGDLVINSLWAWARGLGVSRYHGIVSTAYGVYRVRRGADVEPPFVHELVRSIPFHWELHVRSKGVWTSRLQLTDEAFLGAPFPLPPLPEQSAIVRFLDHADRQIRRYILAKQKLIKLLEEQKQAIIHRAVTRGLDPTVRLKPSGVEFLDDLPEHWVVSRLGQLITPIEQGWSPQCDSQPAEDYEWGVLKVGCVNRETFDGTQNKKLPSALEPIPGLEIKDGDILVSRANTRELLGLAAVAVRPREKLILCDKLFRFRPKHQLANHHFLVSVIRQRTSRAQIESSTNGASDSMQNIGQGVIRNLLLSLPPLEEQLRVVTAISEQAKSINAAISQAQSEMSLLREYRTRMTADVVTGKLDVREAAARLGGEADEPEPVGDIATVGTDELADDADGDVAPEEDKA
jgi:type I restriction enzyme, S subunit